MIDSRELERLLLDIALGKPPPPDEAVDLRRKRVEYASEVAAIRQRGGSIEVPHEFLDLDDLTGVDLDESDEDILDEPDS